MTQYEKYLNERYMKFEAEDSLEQFKKENHELKKQINNEKKLNENLNREVKKLKKENKHFKSTKAYKIWKKYAKIKDDEGKENQAHNSKNKNVGNKTISENKKTTTKNLKDITVAFISDQFSYDSFKYEFNLISLKPKSWKRQFEEEKVDLFFCESTWHGHNYSKGNGHWYRKIIKYNDDTTGSREVLFEILEYCKDNNIPTIFWNKEDPVYYNNETQSFAETAQYFDYIFTSAKECINKYKEDYNHPHVYPLMFAGQPKLFNPLNLTNETIDELVFAGSFNPKHEERVRKMVDVIDRILDEWKNIRIYDRFYGKKWAGYPEKYENFVNPPIDYFETAAIYKKMKWGLNINTVTESETMFARRIFELALTNNNILTNYSKGVKKIFKEDVFYFDEIDTLPDFNGNYEKKRLNNLYNVLENHTYTERWKEILDTIGFAYKDDEKHITIIYKIESLSKLDEKIDNFNKIIHPFKDLQIILSSTCLDDHINLDSIKEKHSEIENIYLENQDYEKELKDNINSEYWIISKDFIEPDFIKKAILHYKYLNKHYAICKGEDKFILGMEKDYENKVIPRERLDYLDGNDDIEVDVYYI
ncbi:MAG: hypothetical protein MJ235_00155 [archaeon]|nr:hypothetical protein [archaeon]